ncbi:hypothetical protein HDU78_005597 [Chytriomyces hyalinus]|nr:hypothetical protein HDU78_005597 [Chytriomyces hyalinus]KAJ3251516.1 hypothetical protein HDU77_005829 [Chytriomyces hyalinus]
MTVTTMHITQIGPGCYNLIAPLKNALGKLLKMKTHMSFVQLSTGKFIALSTVELDAASKAEVDALTQNGELLEAVIGTNPFHGLAFEGFYKMYPNAKYYGTPRHIRNIKSVPWAGSIADDSIRTSWMPELDLQITQGAEFINIPSESYNHFAGVVAFHVESKTLICDDCFSYEDNPGALKRLAGISAKSLNFHPSLYGPALRQSPTAVQEFYDWMLQIMQDWDFDQMATAHGGVMKGGCKEALRAALDKAKPSLEGLAKSRGGKLVWK